MRPSLEPLWSAGSQFPGLAANVAQDSNEVSGRVSTSPRGGRSTEGAVLGSLLVLRNQRMARRLCLSVFLPPKLFCLQEDLQHEANQGAVPVVSWPSSELGCLTGSCRDEASFLGCLRLFHFWTRYPGTAEAFFGAALLALWLCASASTLLQKGPGSPVHVEQSALDTTPFSKGRIDCR